MHVADHLTLLQLQELASAEPSKRRFLRLRALILARSGMTAFEVAHALGVARRSVQNWVARYNNEGLTGLNNRPGGGRPAFLDHAQLERLQERIDAGAQPEDGVCTLRGPEIHALLEREFGVIYSLSAVYVLLHRLGYSCLDPRPKHQQADPEAQEAFKKKSAKILKPSPANTPTSGLKSGSKTKPGSVRKAR